MSATASNVDLESTFTGLEAWDYVVIVGYFGFVLLVGLIVSFKKPITIDIN